MNIIIYFCSYIIAIFILYLITNDLKKFNVRLYNKIDYKIWIKVYSLISIILIHAIWLFSVLFTNNINNSIIYGLPYYLLFSYIIYIIAEIKTQKDHDISYVSEKINKYMNYLVLLYFIFIIIIMLIPNDIKKSIIKCMKSIIDKYVICD
jgi:L-asparagine transporter-like permease